MTGSKDLSSVEYLKDRFKAVYNPGQNIAIDEAMIKFQGRSTMKWYQAIKRGIKVWVLTDSTNGYFSHLQVYAGRKGETVEAAIDKRELTQDFQHKWYHAYFDNFFTSKLLLCDLKEVGVYGQRWIQDLGSRWGGGGAGNCPPPFSTPYCFM